jgi:hypothetical protein
MFKLLLFGSNCYIQNNTISNESRLTGGFQNYSVRPGNMHDSRSFPEIYEMIKIHEPKMVTNYTKATRW